MAFDSRSLTWNWFEIRARRICIGVEVRPSVDDNVDWWRFTWTIFCVQFHLPSSQRRYLTVNKLPVRTFMFAIVRLEGFTLAEAKHTNLCSVSSRSSEDIFMGSFLVLVIKTESRVTPSHKQFMLHMKCGTSTHKHTHTSLWATTTTTTTTTWCSGDRMARSTNGECKWRECFLFSRLNLNV